MMYRFSPLALAGLVALAVLLPPRSKLRNPTILLLLFVVGFLLFLSLASKKLDRYALPVFPALDLLAGPRPLDAGPLDAPGGGAPPTRSEPLRAGAARSAS